MLEPRERLEFDLARIAEGDTGVHMNMQWFARSPLLSQDEGLSAEEAAAIGRISPSAWIDLGELEMRHSQALIGTLRAKKLLVDEDSDLDASDRRLREVNWRSAAAIMHYGSRWNRVDTQDSAIRFTESFEGELLDRLGAAPPVVAERGDPHARIRLERPTASALDSLLDRRVTCRNFDTGRAMPKDVAAAVLYRVFGARAVYDYLPGLQVLKKGVPSAGGLHPTEAYVLIQHVDGLATGLYHYHPVEHALEPIRLVTSAEASALTRRFVASQAYFVDAHVLVFPASRFLRQSWKYRDHAKAYRALVLDVGHLSQTLYLAATELGLGAFITAAINEIDIEEEFGLDPFDQGPMAVCGFGYRADECDEFEFDPLRAVWAEEA